jgi:hypothetical protein
MVVEGTTRRARAAAVLLTVASLLILLALTPAGGASPMRAAANSVTFTDSTGEDAAAPDITTITVSNDDQGMITWKINTPNKATLTADMLFLMFVDADANSGTGDDGFDYAIELDGPVAGSASIALFRWNGTEYSATGVPQSSLTFSYANGPTIRLNRADIGGTARFGFWTIAISGVVLGADGQPDFNNIHRDFAPEVGTYSYDVKITPPRLVMKTFSMKPLTPRAGRLVSVVVTFARSDGAVPSAPPSATCRATVGGRALRASATVATNSRATCTWALAKTAKGKTIRGTITVQADGLKASRPFTARVV